MSKLTQKQKTFARALVSAKKNQTEAYIEAYNVNPDRSDWVKREASRLVRKEPVVAEISRLSCELDDQARYTRQKAFTELDDALRTASRVDNAGAMVLAIREKVRLSGLDGQVEEAQAKDPLEELIDSIRARNNQTLN